MPNIETSLCTTLRCLTQYMWFHYRNNEDHGISNMSLSLCSLHRFSGRRWQMRYVETTKRRLAYTLRCKYLHNLPMNSSPPWKTRPVIKPVINWTSSTSVQNVVFRCEYMSHYSSEIDDNDGTFSLAPKIRSLWNLIWIARKTIKWQKLKRGILRALKTGLLYDSACKTDRVFHGNAEFIDYLIVFLSDNSEDSPRSWKRYLHRICEYHYTLLSDNWYRGSASEKPPYPDQCGNTATFRWGKGSSGGVGYNRRGAGPGSSQAGNASSEEQLVCINYSRIWWCGSTIE